MSQINSAIKRLVVVLLPLLASSTVWALQSDREQPIDIKADRVEINEKTEISHYQGNVYLKQGTLIIQADNVLVYLKNGSLFKIMIDGKPATFEQKPDDNKDVVQSSARHMEYFATRQLLILKKDAHITQGANNFSGDFIEYDTLNSTVKANKDEDSDSRVHAIIHPKSDQPGAETAKETKSPEPTANNPKADSSSKPAAKPGSDSSTK